MARKHKDLPTLRMDSEMLKAFARRADESAVGGRMPTIVDAAEAAPDLAIDVEVDFEEERPTTALRETGLRPAPRTQGAGPEVVPVIAMSREDLEWFQLDPDMQAVVARIDGRATVAELLVSIALPPERILDVLRELEVQRVIALS